MSSNKNFPLRFNENECSIDACTYLGELSNIRQTCRVPMHVPGLRPDFAIGLTWGNRTHPPPTPRAPTHNYTYPLLWCWIPLSAPVVALPLPDPGSWIRLSMSLSPPNGPQLLQLP